MQGDEDAHWEPCPVCGSDELNVELKDVNVAGVWFVRVTIRCDDCVADTTGPPSVLCPTEVEAEEDARLKRNSWATALKAARPPEPEGTKQLGACPSNGVWHRRDARSCGGAAPFPSSSCRVSELEEVVDGADHRPFGSDLIETSQ